MEQDLWAQGPEQDGGEGTAADILCQGTLTGILCTTKLAMRRGTTEDTDGIHVVVEAGDSGERKGKIRR
jgi:hypothetical protein